jgi:hypothetical protein
MKATRKTQTVPDCDDSWPPRQAFAIARRVAKQLDPLSVAVVPLPNVETDIFNDSVVEVLRAVCVAYRAYGGDIPGDEAHDKAYDDDEMMTIIDHNREAAYLLGLAIGLRVAGGAR